LVHSDHAILLENALLDTAQPVVLSIPDHLRAQGDPSAYVVQSRARLDNAFRALLQAAGADIVSYIPNYAYLVRASAAAAQRLATDSQVQAVLPYEPYYKLKPPLLQLAVEQTPLPENAALNVLLFPDARASALADLNQLGFEVLGEERSPFGPVLKVLPRSADIPVGQSSPVTPAAVLPALAALSSVQEVELSRARVLANDLSRARIAVAADTVTPDNYLGLTGTNVLVNVNDSGVDTNHPDLQGRVFCDSPISGVDSNGHGTHVAGIIAGSGLQSLTVTNASGSIMPGASFQFRGQAPAAQILAIVASPDPEPSSDSYLQETAARTNAFISNNSWHYANDNTYDLAAARYDAAVRDALPGVPGSQPLLFIFGAGNAGNGVNDGSGGDPDSVPSPATAKNVITVGAIEQPRFIADQVWQCAIVNGTNICQTNQPWLGLTDTNNAVAAFSSRGNVGVGIEGDFGRFKPDVVAPGTFVVSARSTQWDQLAYYSPTNGSGNHFEVLSNLNDTLGPFYRYESGTSLSAAEVSGALALMQEFFQRMGRTNSPALMKALLINGARPLTTPGAFQVNNPTNSQGWGLINLTNSLPGALTNQNPPASAMLLFDQSPADTLGTGQSHTRFVSLSDPATNQPLRITLVWTDPPGNPAASLKLVNNLDLVVTNLVTGEVFFGNDIPADSSFNQAWDTDTPPNLDVVNNVENVYLSATLATNYSVTVIARNVNVNAVTAQSNDVAQDYALVISSGDGQVADALTVTDSPVASVTSSSVTFITNGFAPSQGISGGLLLNQRVGAQAPLSDGNTIPWPGGTNGVITVGLTNQWRFYVLTNDQDYTNAAFLTFRPFNLSLPRLGVNQTNLDNATRAEADIDLYVSTDPGLTNLDPLVLSSAWMSLSRGGAETVVLTNALPGLYYIGVKAESGEAAEYSFLGVFSELPFAETDAQGNQFLRGFPAPAHIPDGSPAHPASVQIFCIAPESIPLHRVVVTNTLSHESTTDLLGTLSHLDASAVLNNHSPNPAVTNQAFVYDDSNQNDVPGALHTDGPGSLRDFAGTAGLGQWLLTLASTNHPGTNDSLAIFLERQPELANGITVSILPGACREDFLYVPPDATNLTVTVGLVSDVGPLEVEVCPLGASGSDCQGLRMVGPATNASISIDKFSNPPLNAGAYFVRLCNQSPASVTADVRAALALDPSDPARTLYASAGPTPIFDDAISVSTIPVTKASPILSVDVGVRIDHPRVSDLVVTLVSPSGTRVLLDENRGGASPSGMGLNVILTNIVSASSDGGPAASTKIINTPSTSGNLAINYDFYDQADTMRVYYGTNRIFDSGSVSNSGTFNVAYGPGDSSVVTIIMDEESAPTEWYYDATNTSPGFLYTTFTENTNLAVTPIKFAPPPFTNVTLNPVTLAPSTGIYYLPEQSLDKLAGELALGDWTLEIRDSRAGATNPQPSLVSWQLSFLFKDVMPWPLPLTLAAAQTNAVAPGRIQYYFVNAPLWAKFATNQLLAATAPVNLLFNQDLLPTGTNSAPPDFPLLSGATTGSRTLAAAGGSPRLVPGLPYFLGVQNTNATAVTFALAVDFDITPLVNGVPVPVDMVAGPQPRYFSFEVPANATAAAFQLLNLSGNADLVVRKDLPLPTLDGSDYGSFYPGTNSEQIIVFTNTAPVPLSSGRWYLGAFNVSATNLTCTVLAAAYTNALPNIIPLLNGIPIANTNPGPASAADFYSYVVSTNAVRVQFEITQPSADLTLVARKGLPLPTLASFDLLSANPGPNDELIVIYDYSSPVPLSPGEWFLSAINVSGGPAVYSIRATEFRDHGTPIVITSAGASTNDLCLSWTSLPDIHYYVQGKPEVNSTNWVTVSPTITAAETQTTWCITLPSPHHFFRVSEGLVVTPYVPPVLITNITRDTNGVFLQWLAPTNRQFQVQWTPSLAPPAWTPFTNILTSTNGVFWFLDDGSQSGGRDGPRYYRLEQLP
jgi:subtilisin-like proprotein convertase family protein